MKRSTHLLMIFVITGGLGCAAFRVKQVDPNRLPPAAARQGITYAADIKPLLDQSCVKCHGGNRPKAGLRLDSLDAVLAGDRGGKVVEPGSSERSLLLINVAHLGDEDGYMPPPNNKLHIPDLTAEQMGLLRAWIDQGAK